MNIKQFQELKNKRKIVMITAYDNIFSSLFADEVDAILIGDSLNMSFNGAKDTLSISLKEMIYHAKAVKRGSKNTMLIFDMPFGTYDTKENAFKNAKKVYRKTMVDAIKIEGGEEKKEIIKYLHDNNIAVMGHIGLLPQQVRKLGGYYILGKTENEKKQLLKDAKAVEEAGAFAIVIEGVTKETASLIAKSVNIPIIGIGAGNEVDGQILVYTDMLGLFQDFTPKFVRKYMDGANLVKNAIKEYKKDVLNSNFPDDKESY